MGKKNLGNCGVRKKYVAMLRWVERYGKYLLCVGLGFLFFLAAKVLDQSSNSVENGVLKRNPCGQGEAVYEISVDGLEEKISVELHVPEQVLSEEQFQERIPEITELLLQRMLGENPSLQEVRSALELVREIPEYGVDVVWRSERPEFVGVDGSVYSERNETVYLEAELRCGNAAEVLEIPVTVYPPIRSTEERFQAMLEELILQKPDLAEIILPTEFEGERIRYYDTEQSSDVVFLILGFAAAVCMFLREKERIEEKRKQREEYLMADYPDLVYGVLILVGAGYSTKAAWRKLAEDYLTDCGKKSRPLCGEMQITMNQMETGTPEVNAYAEFGRRCGLRSYLKFASLLESSISTGGKNLRKLLEKEVEEAFKMRADMARRKGEEASSKLLLPTFAMLGVVMVMVMAPAFLAMM